MAMAVGDADMLRKEGNVSEAVQTLVSALAHNPSAVALHTSLGRLLLERAEGAVAGAGALDDALTCKEAVPATSAMSGVVQGRRRGVGAGRRCARLP